ncbi:hypothetical protein [Alistipes indistinctus]|uniref:hypothetical protein n=1 Tax=Alistipes indistinctus TaxID=626932 RepID=UPI00351FB7EB
MNKISEIPEQESIPENPAVETSADPWRCEECGSLRSVLPKHGWTAIRDEVAPAAPEQDDLWCDGLRRAHPYQIRESELMSDTVEPWWNDGTTEEDREIITGLNPENFSPKDDRKAFRDACDMWWNGRTNDEKIRLWRQATAPEEE